MMSKDPVIDQKRTEPENPPRAKKGDSEPSFKSDATTSMMEATSTFQKAIHSYEIEKKPSLLVLYGQEVGRVIPINQPVTTIGKSSECDEVIDGEGVSRFHARIRIKGDDTFIIQDLDSTNGTFIQGKRIRETILKDGDKILLGRRMLLKFTFHDKFDQSYFQEMYESSTRDALTGAHNRKYLSERIVADISFARRHRIPFTLIIFDLDHFKNVNDTYGHLTGDQALKSVTSAISSLIRAEDTLARYGGEEFAVLAQGTNFEGGKVLGERIRQRIAMEPIPVLEKEGEPFYVTVSVGVATVPAEAIVHSTAVIAIADENLYKAKAAGRNQVVGSLAE